MCYSAKVRQDFERLRKRYGASIDWDRFLKLVKQRELGRDIGFDVKIPDGLINGLISKGGVAAKEIGLFQRRHKVYERESLESNLKSEKDLLAQAETKHTLQRTKTSLRALEAKRRKVSKIMNAIAELSNSDRASYRIYPRYFAPIVISDGGQKIVVPARYRILPRTGVEVPNQYNVFNSRRDSLRTAKNWKMLFGERHAIFPFENFYEWVEQDNKSVEICFNPDGHQSMHAASLYERFVHPTLGEIFSFAMVTDTPPVEVSAAGHDRCPVFLEFGLIDEWLNPSGKTLEQLDNLLSCKENTHYSHEIAA